MTETTLYERLLGIERPWRVHDVRLALERGDVEVGVELVGETLVCPACGAACPGYDRRRRVWRHLDTMQYRTLVRAEVPRVRCAEHGVQQVPVPVGGCAGTLHSAVRGDGDRLAEGGELRGGGPPVPVELGPGGGNPGAGGAAGAVAARGGRGAAGGRRRDVLSTAARNTSPSSMT